MFIFFPDILRIPSLLNSERVLITLSFEYPRAFAISSLLKGKLKESKLYNEYKSNKIVAIAPFTFL